MPGNVVENDCSLFSLSDFERTWLISWSLWEFILNPIDASFVEVICRSPNR